MDPIADNEGAIVHQAYLKALDAFSAGCRASPGRWFGQADQFRGLRSALLPYAERGDANCQYAVASIAFLGLCCASQEEYEASAENLRAEATPWWLAAAQQGCWWAVDNLVVCGVGPEADRARAVAGDVKRDSPQLVRHDAPTGMPIYGPDFMREVTRRLYGVVKESRP